jgi:hypothetical protein
LLNFTFFQRQTRHFKVIFPQNFAVLTRDEEELYPGEVAIFNLSVFGTIGESRQITMFSDDYVQMFYIIWYAANARILQLPSMLHFTV